MSDAELSAGDAGADRASLVLVSTPIGNLDDISARALDILRHADAIACEDTRVTAKLLDHHVIKDKRLIATHDHNEAQSAAGLVKLIKDGCRIALVSDAGMPGISDPGYRVVQAVLDAGFEVSAVPGPNAALMALTISGLPTDRFVFLGFPPRKSGKRQKLFETYADLPASLILYESAQRLGETLDDAIAALGDRKAALGLELTKSFERMYREPLSALKARVETPPRGEAVLIIEGAAESRTHTNKYAAFSKAPER